MCMSAVTCAMNLVHFSRQELEHLDVWMRETLKGLIWMDNKSSEERLYMAVKSGGRGVEDYYHLNTFTK